MTLQSEIANAWSRIRGVEEITLTPKNPSATAITGVKALRRQVTRQAASLFGAGILQPNTTLWELWDVSSNGALGVVPKDGDTITTASSVVWTIQQVVESPQTSRWQCFAVKQIGTTL